MQQQQVSEPEPVHIFWLRFFKDVSMISFLNLWTTKTQGMKKRTLVFLLKHPVSDAMPIAYCSLTYSSSIERNGGAPA